MKAQNNRLIFDAYYRFLVTEATVHTNEKIIADDSLQNKIELFFCYLLEASYHIDTDKNYTAEVIINDALECYGMLPCHIPLLLDYIIKHKDQFNNLPPIPMEPDSEGNEEVFAKQCVDQFITELTKIGHNYIAKYNKMGGERYRKMIDLGMI